LRVAGHTSRSGRVLNYPAHWAGLGLLLLRGTVGITVAMQAWLSVTSTSTDFLGALPAAALVLCGVALTVGIFTRVCSTLVGLGYALVLFMPLGGAVLPRLDAAAAIVSLAAAAGLALLGPGAISIDARLFGRRAIFIPAKDDSERR
jgi:putative oxidoreductase